MAPRALLVPSVLLALAAAWARGQCREPDCRAALVALAVVAAASATAAFLRIAAGPPGPGGHGPPRGGQGRG